jgi:two-component system OmpR family sensor kinase
VDGASVGAAGRALLAGYPTVPELATRLAAAARAVTGAPYAVVALDGADAVADPVGATAGADAVTVPFDGGTLVSAGDGAALAELAAFAETALRRAREAEWRREINDLLRHDTRTWLGIGKGYATMLREHIDALTPEQRDRALAGLADAFGKLDTFTRTVLLDEQFELSGPQVRAGDVTAESVVAPLRTEFPGLAVEEVAAVTVRLDPALVRAALEHLVANAFAAGEPVRLAVSAEEDGVRFEVRDCGPGVPEEERALVWERYGRTARSRAEHRAGTGLGLAVVRRVVEAHGGAYGLRDEPGGTAFWMWFPGS